MMTIGAVIGIIFSAIFIVIVAVWALVVLLGIIGMLTGKNLLPGLGKQSTDERCEWEDHWS